MKLILKVWLCSISAMCCAQSSSASDAPVVKEYAPFGGLLFMRGELMAHAKLRFHLEAGNNFQQQYVLFNEVYQHYIQLGLDANPGGKWLLGASARFNRTYVKNANIISKGYVGHKGKLGSLFLYKEISGELFTYGKISGYKPPMQARFGLGISIGKYWKEKTLPFYVQASYKLCANKYLDSTFQFIYQQRFLDQTRLNIEVGVKPIEWFWISAFGMFDTRYYYRLALYDQDGNIISSNARVNEIFPNIGMRLTFLMSPSKQEDYLPGLPLR